MPAQIKRGDYAAMFGPTVGDRVRLADTDLIIEVERDLTTERSGQNAPPMAKRSNSAAAR